MTDKPPAYENQWPAGYGMQSDQPAAGGWTTGAPPPPQQGNPPPQFQQPQPQFQQQQYQPKGTQQVIRKLYVSTFLKVSYHTCAILTRCLYIFYPIFHCSLYCRAVSIRVNSCTKQVNFSTFEPKIHGS